MSSLYLQEIEDALPVGDKVLQEIHQGVFVITYKGQEGVLKLCNPYETELYHEIWKDENQTINRHYFPEIIGYLNFHDEEDQKGSLLPLLAITKYVKNTISLNDLFRHKLSPLVFTRLINDCFDALNSLHSCGIIHGDLGVMGGTGTNVLIVNPIFEDNVMINYTDILMIDYSHFYEDAEDIELKKDKYALAVCLFNFCFPRVNFIYEHSPIDFIISEIDLIINDDSFQNYKETVIKLRSMLIENQ